ncbi:MAG TPA: tRNA pseudouridine(55) synthase TruB [Gemmatimonadaceae bacterium]|nr:tRNA pseudouridine(55) synthase TruB [Gemmatimonadaceae bacterium]
MRQSAPTDAVLLVDKPAGVSSHDVVLAARRATGERRIGHGGTLDPFATGLLVLLVGRATRLLPYMSGEPKVYEATIRFGDERDTDDLGGVPVRAAPPPSDDAVRAAIPQLTGELLQTPPAYSAKHVGGRRAYAAARAGETVVLEPSRVTVHEWRLGEWRRGLPDGDELDVRITCGGGTYIRALARDLGRLTGSAAHLSALRRTRSGVFDVGEATPLAALGEGIVALRPALDALRGTPIERLGDDAVGRIVRGIDVPATVPGAVGALVSAATGALVAVAERRGDRWQPRVVMHEA